MATINLTNPAITAALAQAKSRIDQEASDQVHEHGQYDSSTNSWSAGSAEDYVAGLDRASEIITEALKAYESSKTESGVTDEWTCEKCGEPMRFNVPRLGPNGGFVHARTGSLMCAAAPAQAAPAQQATEVPAWAWKQSINRRGIDADEVEALARELSSARDVAETTK